MGTRVEVARIPNCDFCTPLGRKRKAYADARTWTGKWAYVCREHFAKNDCSLGTGRGQELILAK